MTLPSLHVSGNTIKDSSGKTIILRGVNTADPGSLMFFKRERPHDLFKIMEMAVKEWRANVIRLPVHPEGIDDVPGFEGDIKKYFTTYIIPAVDKAAKLGVYAIIDLHIFEDYTTAEKDRLIRAFWGIAAPYYKDTAHVMFELFNEPVKPDDWDTWKTYSQPWVDMIRKLAPENLLLVGGPRWCQNMAGASKNPISGKNIMYAAHCYPAHLADFEKNWGPLFDKYPVFFTEWGYEKPGTFPWEGTTSGFGEPFKKMIEARGCSWCAWCFDNDWGPRVFDKPWELPADGEGRMGAFLKEWLNKNY
jgi:hypothetical protein